MTDTPLPDRLSVEADSEYCNKALLPFVEVYFNNVRQVNSVVEYCVSEGWIRRRKMTALGKVVLERGEPVITKHNGVVRVERKASK